MTELKYDSKTGRLLFTKEMKKEYTILMPNMAPIHFNILQNVFNYYATSRNFSTLAALKLHRQVLNMFITTPVTLRSL